VDALTVLLAVLGLGPHVAGCSVYPWDWGNCIGSWLNSLWTDITNGINAGLSTLGSWASGLLGQVDGIFSAMYSGFANLYNTLAADAEFAIFAPIVLFLGLLVSGVLAVAGAILLAFLGIFSVFLWLVAGLATSLAPVAGPAAPLLADVIFGALLLLAFWVLFFSVKAALAASKFAVSLA